MALRQSHKRRACDVRYGAVQRSRPLRFEALEDRRLLTAVIGNNMAVGSQLRNYRIAIGATAEYTAFHGGQTEALGAIGQLVADLNKIYEPELAIHLELVSGTNVIYTNSATDPYTSGDLDAMLGQNQNTLDALIGSGNYDVGHVFDYSIEAGGGLSVLGSVGVEGSKARGATGSYNPLGPAFVNTVAHELGHQFGADHTFNSTLAGTACGDPQQWEPTNAYEPASGSTLMSYAGICPADDSTPSDNLQVYEDRVFHAASFEQIQMYIGTYSWAAPFSTTPLDNDSPTVDGGLDYTVPARTPFELTATGTDPDAGDRLTYSWEELDFGPSQSLPLSDNGSSPLFRAFAPAADPTRVFPSLPELLANVDTAPQGEALPTTNRNLNFRVTARDGRGGVNSDDVLLTVVDTGAAFAVTAPNSAVTWTGGSLQTITWNVAGTTGNGINAANVDIFLSTDGGQTFPFTLATTANDGSQQITVPNFNTTTSARIKIQGAGHVFFDVSDEDFTIASAPASPGVTVVETSGSTRVFEGSTTDTYNIALNTAPMAGPVIVELAGGSQMEISIDGTNFSSSILVSLTTAPWPITVRALNDSFAEGLHTGQISHSIFESGSPEYPVGLLISGVTVTIDDDELPPLVGVEFQDAGSSTPLNWTEISSLWTNTYYDLVREDGVSTPIDLTISSQASAMATGTTEPLPYTVPAHNPHLSDLRGLRTNWAQADETADIDFTWKGLTPGTKYGVSVFVVEQWSSPSDADQTVTITGSGADDPAPFVQNTVHKEGILLVNGEDGDDRRSVHSYAHVVTADANGQINIHIAANDPVNNPEVYIAGLAIHEVAAVAPTLVATLTDGTLTITDSDPAGMPNQLTVIRDGTDLVIRDAHEQFLSAPAGGTLSNNDQTLTIPWALATALAIDLAGGNDVPTVDVSGGNPVPSGGLSYDGGSGGHDTLILAGGAFHTITYTHLNAHDGSISLDPDGPDGAAASVITYTGLEPVSDNLDAVNRVFSFTGGAETITLAYVGGADGHSQIVSTLGESVTFANPTASLTVATTAGTGADTMNVEGLDAAFDADFIVTANADDTLRFQTNPTGVGTGDLDLTAGNIRFTKTLTTTGSARLEALAGSILDDSGVSDPDLVAAKAVLIAETGVALDLQVGSVEADSGSGVLSLQNAGALTIGGVTDDLNGVVGGDDITIVAAGDLTVSEPVIDTVGAGYMELEGYTVLINADILTAGSTLDIWCLNDGGAPDDGDLILNATIDSDGGDVYLYCENDVTISGSVLTGGEYAELTAFGSITFTATGRIDAEVSTGTDWPLMEVTASESITMADGSLINARDGELQMLADGDIAISSLVGDWFVSVFSRNGSILDGGDSDPDVVSETAELIANRAGAVGTAANPLDTQLDELWGKSVTGFYLVNAGPLDIVDTVVSTGGDVQITAAGDLTVSEEVSSGGTVTLGFDRRDCRRQRRIERHPGRPRGVEGGGRDRQRKCPGDADHQPGLLQRNQRQRRNRQYRRAGGQQRRQLDFLVQCGRYDPDRHEPDYVCGQWHPGGYDRYRGR